MGEQINELVDAAQQEIRRIEGGNVLAAVRALRMASVGLRDVLGGRLPDPERTVYLEFLLAALEQITKGAPAIKALGLWPSGRPQSISEDRDLSLFLAVGVELDKLDATVRKRVFQAIAIVAARRKLGIPTVRKAWKTYGAQPAWEQAKSDAASLKPGK